VQKKKIEKSEYRQPKIADFQKKQIKNRSKLMNSIELNLFTLYESKRG
jgi:hypothetical protein